MMTMMIAIMMMIRTMTTPNIGAIPANSLSLLLVSGGATFILMINNIMAFVS